MDREQKITDLKVKFQTLQKKQKQKTHPKSKDQKKKRVKTEISKIVYHYFGLFEMQNFVKGE